MTHILKYKDYTGNVQFDAEDGIFHGRILGIEDIVGFEGASIEELESDFRQSVDDYIETCSEIGKMPQMPFFAKIVLDLPSDLHIAIAAKAGQQHKSVDSWIVEACRKIVTEGIDFENHPH